MNTESYSVSFDNFKDLETAFIAFKQDYVEYVSQIATVSDNFSQVDKNLVLIQDEFTYNKLQALWLKWDKFREGFSKFPDKCKLTSPKYQSPAWVYTDVTRLKIYRSQQRPVRTVTREVLFLDIQKKKKRFEKAIQTAKKPEEVKLRYLINQCNHVCGELNQCKPNELFRIRKPASTATIARVLRTSPKVLKFENGEALEKEIIEREGDAQYQLTLNLKQVGLFILDLDKEITPQMVKKDNNRREKESIERSSIVPLALDGIITGEVYKVSDLEA